MHAYFLACSEERIASFGGGRSGAGGDENDDDAVGGDLDGSGCDYGDGGDEDGVDVGGDVCNCDVVADST